MPTTVTSIVLCRDDCFPAPALAKHWHRTHLPATPVHPTPRKALCCQRVLQQIKRAFHFAPTSSTFWFSHLGDIFSPRMTITAEEGESSWLVHLVRRMLGVNSFNFGFVFYKCIEHPTPILTFSWSLRSPVGTAVQVLEYDLQLALKSVQKV